MKPIDCEIDTQKDVVKIAFEVTETNKHLHILEANAFQYYTVNASHACTFDYTGPNYVLFNDYDRSLCPLKFGSINGPDVILSSSQSQCTGTKPDYLWSKNSCFERDHSTTSDLVQIKRVGYSNYILCSGFNVTIFNQTFQCPDKVFTFPTNVSFSIEELKYSTKVTHVNSQLEFVPFWQNHINSFISPGINPYHISTNHLINDDQRSPFQLQVHHFGWTIITILLVFVLILVVLFWYIRTFSSRWPSSPNSFQPEEWIELQNFSPQSVEPGMRVTFIKGQNNSE